MEDKILKYLWKMSLYISQNKLTLTDEKDNSNVMDQWIIEKCKIVINNYLTNIQNNDLDKAKEILDKFFVDDFYKVYRLLFDNKIKDKQDYDVSKNVLLNVYLEILKMYILYYPEIIKFIYNNLYFSFKNLLYKDNLKEYVINDSVLSFGEDIKDVIKDVNKFRMEINISKKSVIDSVSLNIKKSDALKFSMSLDEILKLINAKNVTVDFGDETYVETISNNKINVKKR